MQFIANQLSVMGQLGRHVADQTGLTGLFDFTLEWSPDPTGAQAIEANPVEVPPGATFTQALTDQLGLRLVSGKGPVEILVVDRIERSAGN